jgi:D-alanine--D-alanine ligase
LVSGDSGRRIRVAVVFGGRSTEHSISCASAGLVLGALDPDRYEVVPVGITRDGNWVLTSGDPARLALGSGAGLPSVTAEAGDAVAPLPGGGWVSLSSPEALPPALGEVDVVLPLLHGAYGEDGTIQGLLELTGTRYVGAGVFASAAGMDKEFTKLIFAARGLPVGPYVVVRAATWGASAERKRVLDEIGELGWPVFVKPARGGSSIGISRCTDLPELEEAVATALSFDPKVLVEAAIDGIEVECAVLEGIDGGPTEASVPGQVLVDPRSPFYDFSAKYLAEGETMQIPAAIPPSAAVEVRQMACAAFDAISCEGLARVDFFYTTAGDIVLNEINTMPGMTPASGFPLMWAATGLPAAELFDRIIRTALAKPAGLRLGRVGFVCHEPPCMGSRLGDPCGTNTPLGGWGPHGSPKPGRRTTDGGAESLAPGAAVRSSMCRWRELLLLARGLGGGGIHQGLEVRAGAELRH